MIAIASRSLMPLFCEKKEDPLLSKQAMRRVYSMTDRQGFLRMRLLFLLLALVCVGLGMSSTAEASAQSRRIVTDARSGYAIYGYDPVAYFTDHSAIPGRRENEYVWNGVSWIFSSRANKAVFMQNPDVYAPQYGGHGALAMARGYASDSNPNVWAIYRNRLFLFYSYTARAAWAEAVDLHVKRADGEWPRIKGTLSR